MPSAVASPPALMPLAAPPPALALIPGSGRPRRSPSRVPASLLDVWLAGLAPRTRQTYRGQARAFARWLGVSLEKLPEALLDRGAGPAAALAREYHGDLRDRGLAPATLNAAMAALKSFTRVARSTGRVNWALEAPRVRVIPYRDTRGPGRDAVRALLATAAVHRNPRRRAQRVLVVRLLHDLALRCAELAALQLQDLEMDSNQRPIALRITSKGLAGAQERVLLPDPTAAALHDWLRVRGPQEGPVILLSRRGVAKLLQRLSKDAGIPRVVAPHQLRHAAISGALASGWDIREVRAFSRHKHIETVAIYDDNLREPAARVAGGVAALL